MPKRTRPSRSQHPNNLPKGAYRLPNGNYATESGGPLNKQGRGLRIMTVHRAEPDPAKVAEVLIAWIVKQTGQGD
jgi:hypothetical protein